MADPEIFISTGEVSGDLHGARLLDGLRRRSPGLRAYGIGGPALEKAGLEKVADIERLSLVGVAEVLPRLRSIYSLFSDIKKSLERRRPRAVVLIDSPDFNLALAKHARKLGLKVVYYIGPTIWAWRRGRIRTIRKAVDLMLTILPFEEEIYHRGGVRAAYVGHPLLDLVHPPGSRSETLAELGIEGGDEFVAILPGSRKNEIRRLLPVLAEAVRTLAGSRPGLHFLFPAASPSQAGEIGRSVEDLGSRCTVVDGRAGDCLALAKAAVVTSGTATLEAALSGTPFVTVYRLAPLSYKIANLLVKSPFIALPNILMGERVVEELIQGRCRPETVVRETERLLDDDAWRERLLEKFAVMKEKLGPGGAAERAAEAVAAEAGLTRTSDQAGTFPQENES